MSLERELYNLKTKILRGKHISETFKEELANDVSEIEKQVKNTDLLNSVIVSSEMREFAESYALWIATVGQRYIHRLHPDFTSESGMDIFVNNYWGKDWMN